MLFNSAIFVFAYLPLVWLGYLIALRLPWARAGIAWLAIASLFFYGYWSPAALWLLSASILFNYLIGRCLDRSSWNLPEPTRRTLLMLAVSLNLATLMYYKYANLLLSSAALIAGDGVGDVPLLNVVLPIGISFYTFTQIAYIVDSYASGKAEHSFIAYVLFVSFFPHLIAGPVLHHSEMMPQFLGERKSTLQTLRFALIIEGLLFFACGMAKKVIIADSIAPAANHAFTLAESGTIGLADSWFGALAYTTQIYFDFSGYSDMAIGLALLFGIRLPLNFNSPYQARSIIAFWRCWHMTLSRFLRDYLYVPLGGNRFGPARRQLNLMLTMLLGGMWHGASWTFLVWGGLHGVYLQINHAWRHLLASSPRLQDWTLRHAPAVQLCSWVLTFLAVVVAWVFFRAESFTGSANMLRGMFAGSASLHADLIEARTLFYIAAGLLIAWRAPNSQTLLSGIGDKLHARWPAFRQPFLQGSQFGAVAFLIVALTLISVSWGTNEFIYFNF
ncbi:MAG: MBOAT family O-acyltransferase [Nitrososphaerales archaeon]